MNQKMIKGVKRVLPNFFFSGLKNVYLNYNKIRFRGKKVSCPICRGNFSCLLYDGKDRTEDVIKKMKIESMGYRRCLCPGCLSNERERLVFQIIKEKHLIRNDMKLLHVAPEPNLFSMLKRKKIDYYPSDIVNTEFAKFIVDIRKTDFDDKYFDGIICNHVLEHVDKDVKAMTELYRILKKGGWAILQVPVSFEIDKSIEKEISNPLERKKIFGQEDHVRLYGKDYVERLESVGFDVDTIMYDNEKAKKVGINPRERLFFCRK